MIVLLGWGLVWADWCVLMVIVLLALRFVFAGVGECAAGVGIGVGWWLLCCWGGDWCGLRQIVLLQC